MKHYWLYSLSAPLFLLSACQAKVEKPNFLVVVTDDQTFETIASLNNTEIHTPNLDRLVNRGMTFTHAFNPGSWSGAVSVASRTMLITGQHLYHARLNDAYLDGWARTPHKEPSTEATLMGEVFSEAGYETFITGKWHNSYPALLKCFQEGKAVGAGMYESVSEEDPTLTQYSRPEKNTRWKPYDKSLGGHWTPTVRDIVPQGDSTAVSAPYQVHKHTSDLYGEQAVAFLEHRQQTRPFFMLVTFNAPHDPRQSPKEYVDLYPANTLKIPDNYLPEHPFDQGDSHIRDEQLAPFPRTKEAVRLHRQEYYAIITHADHVIGKILDSLKESGQEKNTYIIFTSDHGLAVGQHGLMGKQNLYDHTLRVPFIISGPHIPQGKQNDEMIYMQNIFATTCSLAGLPVPPSVDFKSIVPLIKDPAAKGEEYIFGAYRHLQRTIRSKDYKLILYPQVKKAQLFDLKSDPEEIVNCIDDPAYSTIKQTLFQALVQKQQALGDDLNLEGFKEILHL